MKKEVRKCAVCGKKFMPKAVNSTVCSEKCRKALRVKRDKARKAAAKDNKNKGIETLKKLKTPIVDGRRITKKVVKAVCKEKIHVNKPKFVGVNRGDGICFIGFTPDQILQTAINVMILACRQCSIAALAANTKPCKKGK